MIIVRLLVISALALSCQAACPLPSANEVSWLPTNAAPCVHPGQPLLKLGGNDTAESGRSTSEALRIRSPFVSYDPPYFFASQRLCFYDAPVQIPFEYFCDEENEKEWRHSLLFIGHPTYSKQQQKNRRVKRFLRRRNPLSSVIHFQQENYLKEMPEDSPVDSPIVTVKATHASGAALYYSMMAPQDSRSQNVFSLDTMSGEIRLAKSLDREVLDKHVLKVTAYERTDPTVSGSTTVTVEVRDVQDNSPIFERNSYFADIREDAPIGTTVLSVFARDMDAGSNGEIEYLLGEGDGKELLAINSKSGVVQTNAPLDRETLPMIRLDVIARDHGEPRRESSALIEISILDVNDNAPVFEHDSYNVTIAEDVQTPLLISTVQATDKDADTNGKVHYSLVASQTLPITIDYSTGEVTLRNKLDASHSPLTVIVRAKDGAQPALSSTVPLNIHIVDINDHKPTFIAAQKVIFLEESVSVGEEVGRVYAIDEDSGDNGRIRYSMDGHGDFEIDEQSGVIRTVKMLDRERTARYELTVLAQDGGSPPLNSTATIEVIVKDANDNAPEFEQAEYNISISENAPRGSQIIKLKAIDRDENQKIVYRIEGDEEGKGRVAIIDMGDEGAILSLSAPLHNDHFIVVNVLATDQGGLQGRCTVNIIVEDVNSPPYFLPHPYTVKIPEHSPIGFPVILLKAEDSDRGANAELHYSLDSSCFSISNSTGQISVACDIDRETKASFALSVKVSDSAPTPLTTTTQIEVIIDDINDNAPVFSSANYETSISEDIPVGTSFIKISAVDADVGQNGIVDYFINETSSGAGSDLFRLDRTSGTLRVNAPLDRETTPVVHLNVYASDRGAPPLSSSSLVTIRLSDVNDNPPRFEQSVYDLYIAENSPIGSTVGTVVANDPDEADNANIEFRIVGGTDARLFDIEASDTNRGVVRILTRSVFDYEAKTNKFQLEIQASSGELSSTATLRIHVSDANDNQPILKDFTLLINTYEEGPYQREIGAIPAFDPDQNATLEYYLEENDLIEADKYSGRLRLKRQWKRAIEMNLKACVSDGPNTACSTCQLIHTPISTAWLRQSVTLSLRGISIDSFWDRAIFNRFRESLSTLSTWSPQSIRVISASAVDDNVHVSFAVAPSDTPIRAWNVEERLKVESKRIERMALIKMNVVKEESCAKEPCTHFHKCREALKYVNQMQFHQTDNFLARTLKTVNTFVCECPNGFTTSSRSADSCDIRMDLCFDQPCQHNGTCISLENSFRCVCQPPWTGDRCETSHALTCLPGYCSGSSNCALVEKSSDSSTMKCENCGYSREDSDERCRLRAVHFDGSGIINVNRDPSRIEWTIEFSIATISQNGVLMFSGNKKSDFVEVSLKNRIIEVEFSLGGKSKSIKMKNVRENHMNDGKWHNVKLEFYDKKLTASLDDCDTQASLFVANSHCATQIRAELPAKCLDPTVPCFRFLDTNNGIFFGGRPSGVKHVEEGYEGCISNVTIDGEIIDLSTENVDRNTGVQDGCRPMQDYCRGGMSKCPRGRKCHSKWNGHICHCAHSTHDDKKECAAESLSPSSRPLSLMDEESFISLRLPPATSLPFHFSAEFRTSRDDIQLFVIEFEQRNVFYKLEISNGLLKSSLPSHSSFIDSPLVTLGHWFKIDVYFSSSQVVTTFDGIYKLIQPVDLPDVSVEMIYSGVAPSTGHPSRFEGCIRGIALNNEPLTVKEKSKVRTGCIVTNRCSLEGVCPRESRCHSIWDQHKCVCHSGYISDSCVSACSVKGICGPDGTCIRSNNTRGYECICANGLRGANCERAAPEQICPLGYWGTFPDCRMCGCDAERGYEQQCEQSTGECKCRKGHFPTPFGCVACECGYGTTSMECSKEGQCECKGEAMGRRCDRCRHSNEVLDPKSLKCFRVKDRCASEIDYGIQWPTTLKGSIARQSCPNGEIGLATRLCADTGKWVEVNSWNCTRHEYSIMVSKFDVLDSFELLDMLKNATKKDVYIRGKNQQIAAVALMKIIEKENVLKCHDKGHVKDSSFSPSLLECASKILQSESPSEYLRLARRVADFGRSLFECHQKLGFLNPFQITQNDFMFTIDRLDYSHILPKFNNLLDTRPVSFPSIRIFLSPDSPSSFSFFSILARPRCTRCSSSLVAVHANLTSPIRVEFPLTEENDWKYPECAKLQGSDDSSWTAKDANLIGLNLTHAVCEFSQSGIFTLLTAAHKGLYLRFSHSSSLAAPILTGISLLLCLFSLILTFTRRGIKTHLIRVGFILFFSLNVVSLFFVHRVSVSQVFCPVRNALLSFTTSSPFGWLLLYSLHIYRMLSDGSTRTSSTVCLLLGLVLPCLFSCFVFIFTSSCTMAPSGWLFWFILLPIGLFLLLSFYASATCLLVTIHKQYDAYVMKFNLRKALFQHFILSAMLLINTVLCLLLPRGTFPSHIEELLCSISFVATALYIAIWSACPGKTRESSLPVAMWVEEEKKMTRASETGSGRGTDGVGRNCDSPLLYETEDEGTTCTNWMNTTGDSDHHERRLLSQQINTNHILSPADKILNEGLGHVYDNMSTLSRLRTERDEADDAYYSYTLSRRYKPTTFTS